MPKPVAEADGAAIAALILSFFVPLAGLILAYCHFSAAKRRGYAPSGVAVAGLIISWVGTVFGVLFLAIFIASIIMAASQTGSYQ